MGASLVGDHRRLHEELVALHERCGKPSTREIHKKSGVSVGTVNNTLAGRTLPSPKTAVAIAAALRASQQELNSILHLAEGAAADRTAVRSKPAPGMRPPRWRDCPYRGLPPFEERHAPIFYGRRQLSGRLVARLREQLSDPGMLLVVGPSGAGKSSLLRAGLMAALTRGDVAPECQTWPRRAITPTDDPVRNLALQLADLTRTDAIAVHQSLSAHPEQAHLLVGQLLTAGTPQEQLDNDATAGAPRRVVLIIDQLEELFTLTEDRQRQTTFLTALHSMATMALLPGGEPGALVVTGLRGDFWDQAMSFDALRDAAERGVFSVGAMSESELQEAITGPATEAGVHVPNELCVAVLELVEEPQTGVGPMVID